MASIYLDYNAAAPLLPEAWEAMRPFQLEAYGNPASSHHVGRRARQALEDARDATLHRLGGDGHELIFTSGATEANNLALFGLFQPPGAILASRIEHPCIMEPLKRLEQHGGAVDWVPVTPQGHVEQREMLARVRPETRLATLMLANHETGAIQPVRHVAKTLPKTILVHTDAAQAVGKIPVNFSDLGVTSLSFSAHKFGGPKGIGGLLLRKGTTLQPLLFGGHQQKGHRPGTEAVALAVGLRTALEIALRNLEANRLRLAILKERFLARLNGVAVVNGPRPGEPGGLPSTLNVSFPGCRAEVLLMALDLAGIACSTGSACSSGSLLPSPVLEAMGLPPERLHSAMRFSFSAALSEAEIDEAASRVVQCVEATRQTAGEIRIADRG